MKAISFLQKSIISKEDIAVKVVANTVHLVTIKKQTLLKQIKNK